MPDAILSVSPAYHRLLAGLKRATTGQPAAGIEMVSNETRPLLDLWHELTNNHVREGSRRVLKDS